MTEPWEEWEVFMEKRNSESETRTRKALMKRYSIDHEPPGFTNGTCRKNKKDASRLVPMGPSPRPSSSSQTACLVADEDNDLIKPKKLVNPVRESRSHQQVQRELLHTYRSVEVKPELQRVLESRRRDQLIKQRKQEEEARRKRSPLEAELLRRHRKLEEFDKQLQEEQQKLPAPEFIKVKENLRRTSFQNDEKEV